jgi:hypothetical protein
VEEDGLEETILQDHLLHTPVNPLLHRERRITFLLKRKDGLRDSGPDWRPALRRDMDSVRAVVGVDLKRGKSHDIIRERLRRIRRLSRVDGLWMGVYHIMHQLHRVDGIGMIMGVLGVYILVLDLAVHADGSLGMKSL